MTRLVEPSSPGATRTRPPAVSPPTNVTRTTPRSPVAACNPVTAASLPNASRAVTRSTAAPPGASEMRPSTRASPQRSVSFAAGPGSAYNVACRSMVPACALTSTGPTRGPSVTSIWTRPLESVTTRGAPNRPFVADSTTSCPATGTPAVSRSSNRRGSGGCAPAAACWPTPSTNPLRTPDKGGRGARGSVAGRARGIEHAGTAARGVVRNPAVLHDLETARQPGARELPAVEHPGPVGETAHHLRQRVADLIELGPRRRPHRSGGGGGRPGRCGARRRRRRCGRRRLRHRTGGGSRAVSQAAGHRGDLAAHRGDLGADRGPHARDRRPLRHGQLRLEPPVGAGGDAAQYEHQQRAYQRPRQLAPAAWRPRRR